MNDALRKKSRETADNRSAPGFSREPRRSRTAGKWLALLAAVVVLAAAVLFGPQVLLPGTESTLLAEGVQPGLPEPPPDLSFEAGSPTEGPADADVDSGPDAEADPPAAPAGPDRVETDPAGTDPPQPAATAGRQASTTAEKRHVQAETPEKTLAPHREAHTSQPAPKRPLQSEAPQSETTATEPARSVSTTTDVIQNHPPDPAGGRSADPAAGTDLFFKKALAYHRSGRPTDAMRLYRQVLNTDPDHHAALLNLAALYMDQGNYPDAQPLLNRLEQVRPRPEGLLVNQAILAIGMGQPAAGLTYLDAAEASNDAPAYDIRFHRAVAFSRMNRLDQALKLYREALLEKPDDSRLHFNLAVACDTLGHYPEALTHYQGYLRFAPDLPAAASDPVNRRIRELRRYVANNPTESLQLSSGKGS
ncbi:MAG: tetratricopeptide repeat protein [Desulfosarcina sp.]